MNNFDISFIFNKRTYQASVRKEPGSPVTYYASIHDPHDLNIKNAIPFIAQRGTEMLGWIRIHEYPELTVTIASAITEYCSRNHIELFKG